MPAPGGVGHVLRMHPQSVQFFTLSSALLHAYTRALQPSVLGTSPTGDMATQLLAIAIISQQGESQPLFLGTAMQLQEFGYFQRRELLGMLQQLAVATLLATAAQ